MPYHLGDRPPWSDDREMLYVTHGSADKLLDQFSHDPDKILCRVPLRMLVPKLTKPNLKEVSSFHGISIPKRRTTDEIKDILSNHVWL
jgi:hypothetical protein